MPVKVAAATRTVLAVLVAVASLGVGHPALAAVADRDHDGLMDRFETHWGITDPARRDTDHDGIPDGLEDEDGDRLSNLGEQLFGTDPSDPDSDGDGRKDGGEDSDRNGVKDALEQDRRPVPAGLRPPLSHAWWDLPPSYRNGCHSSLDSAVIHPCVYGSPSGKVRVALFGDSHALQWLPALERAGMRQGWRITVLTKSACPSVDVEFDFEDVDFEPSCRRWRATARQWLRKNPQHVVVIANEGRYPLVDAQGDRVFRANKEPLWKEGLARLLERLPKRTQAIVLADTPHLKRNPVTCLGQAPSVADCVTRRGRTLLPRHDKAERWTAHAHGAIFGDLNRVVCPYDPCPIVAGNTLMWRDESHLTATYAKQLAPAIRALVEQALDARASAQTPPSPFSRSVEVVVNDDRFEPATIEAVTGEELLVTLINAGREKHDIAFYPQAGDVPVTEETVGPTVDPGRSATFVFTAPDPGEYVFRDDVGSLEATGALLVGETPEASRDEPR